MKYFNSPFLSKDRVFLLMLFFLWSFLTNQSTLVPACSASDLQSTYVMYPDSGIDGNNMYTRTTDECKQVCTDDPMCLNFEKQYSSLNPACNFASVTARDVPNDFVSNDNGWNLYQRNCA